MERWSGGLTTCHEPSQQGADEDSHDDGAVGGGLAPEDEEDWPAQERSKRRKEEGGGTPHDDCEPLNLHAAMLDGRGREQYPVAPGRDSSSLLPYL